MPYPTGTPVDEAILDNIAAVLATIAAPSYHTTVRRVERLKALGYPIVEFPCVIVGVPRISWSDRVANRLTGEMALVVRGIVDDRENGIQSVNWLAADIRKALLLDTTRGGLACWTRVQAQEASLNVEESGTFPSVDVEVLVHFRHQFDDPNTAL